MSSPLCFPYRFLEVLVGRGTGAKTAPGGGRNRVVNTQRPLNCPFWLYQTMQMHMHGNFQVYLPYNSASFGLVIHHFNPDTTTLGKLGEFTGFHCSFGGGIWGKARYFGQCGWKKLLPREDGGDFKRWTDNERSKGGGFLHPNGGWPWDFRHQQDYDFDESPLKFPLRNETVAQGFCWSSDFLLI